MSALKFLNHAPRFLFFTGKGGVGKTSVACATAIQLADAGRQVLLVSTDPASNVGQVFGITIGNQTTSIPAVPGLAALEMIHKLPPKLIVIASLDRCGQSCLKLS